MPTIYGGNGLLETPKKALDPTDLKVHLRPNSDLKEEERIAVAPSDSLFPLFETITVRIWKGRGRFAGKLHIVLSQISDPRKKDVKHRERFKITTKFEGK